MPVDEDECNPDLCGEMVACNPFLGSRRRFGDAVLGPKFGQISLYNWDTHDFFQFGMKFCVCTVWVQNFEHKVFYACVNGTHTNFSSKTFFCTADTQNRAFLYFMHKIMQPDLAQSDFWKATVQIMQNYAKLCKIMQNYAKTCIIMQKLPHFTTFLPHKNHILRGKLCKMWDLCGKSQKK